MNDKPSINCPCPEERIRHTQQDELQQQDVANNTSETNSLSYCLDSCACCSSSLLLIQMYSISIYAFLGAVTRASLAHYLSCDDDNYNTVSVTSSKICFTRADSIWFVDLPANLLGSFIMGILVHPTYKDMIPYGMALQVGFCGSLTTCTYE